MGGNLNFLHRNPQSVQGCTHPLTPRDAYFLADTKSAEDSSISSQSESNSQTTKSIECCCDHGCVGDPAPDPLPRPPPPHGALRAALTPLHSARVGVAPPSTAAVESGGEETAAADLSGMDGPLLLLFKMTSTTCRSVSVSHFREEFLRGDKCAPQRSEFVSKFASKSDAGGGKQTYRH